LAVLIDRHKAPPYCTQFECIDGNRVVVSTSELCLDDPVTIVLISGLTGTGSFSRCGHSVESLQGYTSVILSGPRLLQCQPGTF